MYRKGIGDWRGSDHSGHLVIPSFADVSTGKEAYARAFALHYQEQDPFRGRPVVQEHPKTVLIQNPPALPLSGGELDYLYELPYTRLAHPCYREPVPALEPVAFSITSHRGCFGGCAFCALAHHQGRIIQSRSEGSIVREAERFVSMPGFRGVIQDVGGPTANMFGASCDQWSGGGTCPDRSCSPGCPNLRLSHARQIHLLRRLRAIPGVKRVFIGSGIRYHLLLADPAPYLEEVCAHHVSGHLKVAPEHIVPQVTTTMRKPGPEVFDRFRTRFEELQTGKKKRQYLVPYFMSGHPGCTIPDMVAMALYIRDHRLYTEQVQDFTPTPMSLATCMYYTGLDPFTLQPVHVPKGREKQIQRALLHFREPENRSLVQEGLAAAGRQDLVGSGPGCLIPARPDITRKSGKLGEGQGPGRSPDDSRHDLPGSPANRFIPFSGQTARSVVSSTPSFTHGIHFSSFSSMIRYALARTDELDISPASRITSRISSRDAPFLSAACMWYPVNADISTQPPRQG